MSLANAYVEGRQMRVKRVQLSVTSHLLYANDTLMFCKVKQNQFAYLSQLLMWFEANLRLSINLNKSKLIPVWRVNNVEDLAVELGHKVGLYPPLI